jgi:poly-gamma-glutamate synthesis protein (capsule biosynthesis protein)
MVKNLRQFTEKCDVNYYNQETILGGTEMGLSDYPLFVSPQEAGDAMVDLGYNLVSTATNHSLDGGEEGILNSCEYWKKQKDVLMVGTYDSESARNTPVIKECNGITYTMLNYTYDTNGISVPEGKEYLVNVWPTDLTINDPESDTKYQEYKKQVKKDIKAVRDKVDFLIVAIHAGVEYMPDESAYQDDMSEFLSENGVNLMIGTHPHVIEPARYVGDMMCYYSMGNLLCSQYQDENYNKVTSILSTLTVKKTEKDGKATISFEDMDNQLLYCYFNQDTWRDHLIIPFSSDEIKEYLPEYKSVYKTYKDIFLKLDDSLPFAACAK